MTEQLIKKIEEIELQEKIKQKEIDRMADAGFFYTGKGNIIECHCCGLQIYGASTKNYFEEHAFLSPYCSFLMENKGFEYIYRVHRKLGRSIDPINSDYQDQQARLSSFSEKTENKKSLAMSGFFYSSQDKVIRCYFCNLQLPQQNTLQDDLWTFHVKNAPFCQFVIQHKDFSFITNAFHDLLPSTTTTSDNIEINDNQQHRLADETLEAEMSNLSVTEFSMEVPQDTALASPPKVVEIVMEGDCSSHEQKQGAQSGIHLMERITFGHCQRILENLLSISNCQEEKKFMTDMLTELGQKKTDTSPKAHDLYRYLVIPLRAASLTYKNAGRLLIYIAFSNPNLITIPSAIKFHSIKADFDLELDAHLLSDFFDPAILDIIDVFIDQYICNIKEENREPFLYHLTKFPENVVFKTEGNQEERTYQIMYDKINLELPLTAILLRTVQLLYVSPPTDSESCEAFDRQIQSARHMLIHMYTLVKKEPSSLNLFSKHADTLLLNFAYLYFNLSGNKTFMGLDPSYFISGFWDQAVMILPTLFMGLDRNVVEKQMDRYRLAVKEELVNPDDKTTINKIIATEIFWQEFYTNKKRRSTEKHQEMLGNLDRLTFLKSGEKEQIRNLIYRFLKEPYPVLPK